MISAHHIVQRNLFTSTIPSLGIRLVTISIFFVRLAIGRSIRIWCGRLFLSHFMHISLSTIPFALSSPLMAEQLSYLESKSTAYVYSKMNKRISSADENFSREVMQLFTSKTTHECYLFSVFCYFR